MGEKITVYYYVQILQKGLNFACKNLYVRYE